MRFLSLSLLPFTTFLIFAGIVHPSHGQAIVNNPNPPFPLPNQVNPVNLPNVPISILNPSSSDQQSPAPPTPGVDPSSLVSMIVSGISTSITSIPSTLPTETEFPSDTSTANNDLTTITFTIVSTTTTTKFKPQSTSTATVTVSVTPESNFITPDNNASTSNMLLPKLQQGIPLIIVLVGAVMVAI